MEAWTSAQKKMYKDFHQSIKEGIIDLGVEPSENLIHWVMTRVRQEIVDLYLNWGIDDTECRDELYKTIRETLQMKGYIR